MPDLFDDAPPARPALSADAQTVFDALCFLQAPLNITRLAEFLGDHSTARGRHFHGPELRRLLGELQAAGLAATLPQGPWYAPPAVAWPRFLALLADPLARTAWWASWRRLYRFDHSWHLELFAPEAMVGAIRVVVLAGATPAAFERLCQLSRQSSPEQPSLLAAALLDPFDAGLWDGMDAELRHRVLATLLRHLGGDVETLTQPLWAWLLQQASPDAAALHDGHRLRLAERLLLAGQRDEALRVLRGLDHPEAQALRAAVDIAAGQHASGARAFELAWKESATLGGKRKQLFSDATSWCYALGLIAQPDPAAWTKARKFAAGEAGKRDADPYSFWGVWQEAIDQRLGDAPRNPRRLLFTGVPGVRLHGLQQLSHWLLGAWLGHAPPQPAAFEAEARSLALGYDHAGLPWLAMLVRRSAALLLGQAPLPADAVQAFPVGAPTDRWREALNAIVALGPVGGAAAAPGPDGQADRLIWTVLADANGRVRRIEPLEQKAGARGLGKPKPASLAALAKRSDLPAHDAAVLRAVKKLPYGGRLTLDKTQAVQALVRHPQVAWADAPLQRIEVSEGLPQLEVLTRGDHLQFKVLDPIRPDDAGADDDSDDEDDDDTWTRSRRSGDAGKPPVLLLRDGPEQARLVRVTAAQLRVAELVTQGWQVPVAARAELDAALRVLGTHFQLASDAEAGHEVVASALLRAELTPQGDGLALRLVAAPFGDFGPRQAPGLGRERVTTVHQGVTLSTKRDLAAERAHQQALVAAVDWLDDGAHAWTLDDPEQALAVVEALASLGETIVSEWPKGKPMRVRTVAAPQLTLQVKSQGDWLQIDGSLALDGGEVLRLKQLLALVQQGKRRYVALGDGDFLALGDTLRQQLADLRAISAPQGDQQRVAALAAMAWSAQAGAPALDGDTAWQQRCAAWASAQAQTFSVPAGLAAELRDYQASGWLWLMRLAASGFGAVLADDMGLGKTLQTLALLLARSAGGPALVVAPTSVCGNWLAEAARFAPGLQVELYGDTASGADFVAEPDDEGDAATRRRRTARHRPPGRPPQAGAGPGAGPGAGLQLRPAAARRRHPQRPHLAHRRAGRSPGHQERRHPPRPRGPGAGGRFQAGADRHAGGKPPGRAVGHHGLCQPRPAGQRRAVQRSALPARSSATATPRPAAACAGWWRPSCCAAPRPRCWPTCRRAPRSCTKWCPAPRNARCWKPCASRPRTAWPRPWRVARPVVARRARRRCTSWPR